MELLKKNIHMDRIRCEAVSQITLEDDLNVPDSKPDVNTLNLQKGVVLIDEVKPGTDHASIRGRLVFHLLYHTEEGGGGLACLEGKIPFEEKINLQGALGTDNLSAEGEVEDLSIGVINSRKLSIQSLVTLNVWVEELYDEEAPIGIYGEESVEYRKTPVSLAQVAVCKKDIFRLKEEVSLPGNYPNILQLLWSDVSLGDVEFRVLEEKLQIQGDIHMFLLYEGEGEEHPVRTFEHTVPFNGVLDCHGSREGMIPDIRWNISLSEHGQPELTVRPDPDGEERNISLELALNISLKLYVEESVELVTDLYGVTSQVECAARPAVFRKLLGKVNGRYKVADRIRVRNGDGVLQLLHSGGQAAIEEQEIVEDGIRLSGSLQVRVLYITGNDEAPYANASVQIPWQYTLEVKGITAQDPGKVHVQTEQLQVTMLDGEEMDVKAILSFSTTVFAGLPMELIQDVQVKALDSGLISSLPGMAVYVVKRGDNLWNIGKKYYVPVATIRSLNDLADDDLRPGQKLLVVKGQH